MSPCCQSSTLSSCDWRREYSPSLKIIAQRLRIGMGELNELKTVGPCRVIGCDLSGAHHVGKGPIFSPEAKYFMK